MRDLGGSGVKNPRCNSGGEVLIPVQVAKIPHAMGQLNSRTTKTEPTCLN